MGYRTETLTAERARYLLSYDKRTGTLRWRHATPGHRAGAIAGSRKPNSRGYLVIWVDEVPHQLHRVAWLIVEGKYPAGGEVDHHNRKKADNRWRNLRDATKSHNLANVSKRSHSGQPFKGIERVGSRWRACISIDGKKEHLGMYDTAWRAHLVYRRAAREQHGKFARAA